MLLCADQPATMAADPSAVAVSQVRKFHVSGRIVLHMPHCSHAHDTKPLTAVPCCAGAASAQRVLVPKELCDLKPFPATEVVLLAAFHVSGLVLGSHASPAGIPQDS